MFYLIVNKTYVTVTLGWHDSTHFSFILDCGSPPVFTSGLVNYTTTTVGSVAVYECGTNYTLHGSTTKVCDTNGTWTPTHGSDCRLVGKYIEYNQTCGVINI